jgi:hypothetical protein
VKGPSPEARAVLLDYPHLTKAETGRGKADPSTQASAAQAFPSTVGISNGNPDDSVAATVPPAVSTVGARAQGAAGVIDINLALRSSDLPFKLFHPLALVSG